MNTYLPANKDKWIENYARFGIGAKGVTYLIIGILSAYTAMQGESKGLDKQGAVKEIWNQPFGHVVLVLLTLGFLGYVMWRFIQAFKDPEHKGTDGKGLFKRFTYFISGLIYASLAFSCIRLLMGSGSKSSKKDFILSTLMDSTGGRILIGAVALFVIGFGIYQCYQALTNKFKDEVHDYGVNEKVR